MKIPKYLYKQIWLFLLGTIVFSFLIFVVLNFFTESSTQKLEQKIIEESHNHEHDFTEDVDYDEKDKLKEILIDAENISLESAKKIQFSYFPSGFSKELNGHTKLLREVFESEYFSPYYSNMKIQLLRDKESVRWTMKNGSIKLFWIMKMPHWELTTVWIHEFAHLVDVYFLQKKVLKDSSYFFYDISWESSKILKPGQKQENFVSWYAMTNKYEDFAETFTYFVLHNNDFVKKAEKSEILQAKYNFFDKILFQENSFYGTDFSEWNTVLDYYRDITKIEINLEKFLQFLKK